MTGGGGGDVADPSVAVAPPPPAFLLEMQTGVRACCTRFNADGSLVATGCEDGSVKVHNTTTGQASYYFNPKHYGGKGGYMIVRRVMNSNSTILFLLLSKTAHDINTSVVIYPFCFFLTSYMLMNFNP